MYTLILIRKLIILICVMDDCAFTVQLQVLLETHDLGTSVHVLVKANASHTYLYCNHRLQGHAP